ncbi:hypothetical protein [Streptomyces broussonetiae]|uniref:Uncharacterized protein n=1 Tax=Streptomyces broussonetiae TaxID=2686304 RepID=A0A6I6N267_9ACTN|nr:hypothetical protein [Streptomyces broussonetiae]QHA02955.1 hypothetical protein GQF42_06345 [Streptomyces broussonetiae]
MSSATVVAGGGHVATAIGVWWAAGRRCPGQWTRERGRVGPGRVTRYGR